MKVNDKFLKFDPLAGADGYRVYYDTEPIDQVSSPNEDVGNQTEDISMHNLLGTVDDTFNIGVVPYDNAGNEGDITIIVENYPFDFVPPVGTITGGEIY